MFSVGIAITGAGLARSLEIRTDVKPPSFLYTHRSKIAVVYVFKRSLHRKFYLPIAITDQNRRYKPYIPPMKIDSRGIF